MLYEDRTYQRTRFAEDRPVERTPIDTVSSSQAEKTGTAAAESIATSRPGWRPIIERIDITEDMDIQDILDAIQEEADEAGDDDVDTSEFEISEVKEGKLFIEQLADLAIPTEEDAHIVISSYDTPLLDNIYTPGLDGYVHLDLREFIYENTSIVLPNHRNAEDDDYQTYMEQDGSGLLLDITVTHGGTTDVYQFWANAFKADTPEKMSDIDRIDIPADALIPLTMFRENDMNNAPVEVYLVAATRRVLLHNGTIGDGDGYLINTDVPVSRIPYRMNEPFYLEFRVATSIHHFDVTQGKIYNWKTVRTPVYRVTPADFQQYLFLNDYGHFDIVPMTGNLTLTPEYELENSFRTNAVERAKGTRRSLYTQNSGPLSRQTATVLSSLLLSRSIFIYTPGEDPRRIVIESPAVTISSHNSVNTVTFSWRYAEQ